MGKHKDRIHRELAGRWLYNPVHYESKIQHNPATGCDEWVGVKNNIGYGFVGVVDAPTEKGKMVTAHRLALTIKLGREIAPGMNANHHCHNRLCVTPHHLYEGTQSEKIERMKEDGVLKDFYEYRKVFKYNHKQFNRKYKYSEDDINFIRTADPNDIAAKYGITRNRAVQMRWSFRKSYLWLPLPEDK